MNNPVDLLSGKVRCFRFILIFTSILCSCKGVSNAMFSSGIFSDKPAKCGSLRSTRIGKKIMNSCLFFHKKTSEAGVLVRKLSQLTPLSEDKRANPKYFIVLCGISCELGCVYRPIVDSESTIAS
jgi:hypothetical protein